jgi:hypothetical protein
MSCPYGVWRSNSLDTPHSIKLLWSSDQPDAETSTWQDTTFTRDKFPCCRPDSKLHSQQASDCRSTPWTAQQLGPAITINVLHCYVYLKKLLVNVYTDFNCLSYTISSFCLSKYFVLADLKKMFHTQFRSMFMTCRHIKFMLLNASNKY